MMSSLNSFKKNMKIFFKFLKKFKMKSKKKKIEFNNYYFK